MMSSSVPAADVSMFWSLLTRLGELQLLLPLALLAMALVWRPKVLAGAPNEPPLPGAPTQVAQAWLWTLLLAIGLTAASKLAFFAWGWGVAAWDFTGISGHAMASAAILPGLAWVALQGRGVRKQRGWTVVAMLLAALVAYSRLKVGAHSASEALAGFALGGAVSAFSLRRAWLQPGPGPALSAAWLAALLAALLILPLGAPKSRTHDAVIHLAMKISGRSTVFTREDLHRRPPASSALSLNAASWNRSAPWPTAAASWGLGLR